MDMQRHHLGCIFGFIGGIFVDMGMPVVRAGEADHSASNASVLSRRKFKPWLRLFNHRMIQAEIKLISIGSTITKNTDPHS
jgi:hypothetical protein